MNKYSYENSKPLGIIIIDSNRIIQEANIEIPNVQQKNKEVINKDALNFVHEFSKDIWLEIFVKTLKKKQTNSAYIFTKTEKWCLVIFKPYKKNSVKAKFTVFPELPKPNENLQTTFKQLVEKNKELIEEIKKAL